MKIIFSLLYAVFFLSSLCSNIVGNQNEEEYFLLAFQWPISVCNVRYCHIPVPTKQFTLHGLWPQRFDGRDVPCRNDAPSLTLQMVQPILKSLNEHWPSLYGENNFKFWERQWDKHGKCSGMMPLDYFSLAVNRAKSFKFYERFEKRGMTPNERTHYNPEEFRKGIEMATGTVAIIVCNENKYNGGYQLVEFRVCMLKDGTAISCHPSVYGCGYEHHRPDRKIISFPSEATLSRQW